MIPCNECRFANGTGIVSWPIACHRHAPTTPLNNEDAACWPVVRPAEAAIGCGDGELKIAAVGGGGE